MDHGDQVPARQGTVDRLSQHVPDTTGFLVHDSTVFEAEGQSLPVEIWIKDARSSHVLCLSDDASTQSAAGAWYMPNHEVHPALRVVDDAHLGQHSERIGFGNIELSPKLVTIDGMQPSETTAQDSSYRLVCPLLPLTRPPTRPMAQALFDFTLSDKGRQLVEESGWVPAR